MTPWPFTWLLPLLGPSLAPSLETLGTATREREVHARETDHLNLPQVVVHDEGDVQVAVAYQPHTSAEPRPLAVTARMRRDSLQALEKCTITARLVAAPAGTGIRIAEPSGTMTVEAGMRKSGGAVTGVDYTTVFRTARRLFARDVYLPIHPPH